MSDKLLPYTTTKNHALGAGEIAIDQIFIGNRIRSTTTEDLKYIQEELVPSIGQHGLIHPITVTWNDQENRFELIAGWNRLQAFKILGLISIPYSLRETMSEDDLMRLEIEENIRRKEMRWQDKVLGVYRVHMFESEKAAARHTNWTLQATGKILGVTAASISYILPIAKALLAKDDEVMKCENHTAAYKLLLRRKEQEAMRILHDRTKPGGSESAEPVKITSTTSLTKPSAVQIAKKEAESGVLGGDDMDFDILPSSAKIMQAQSRVTDTLVKQTIPLSERIINADCVEWMLQAQPNQFDLIYTDPPFGINMKMLDNVQGIEIVEKSHHVDENLQLLERLFKAAFRVLKDDCHMFMWYDIVHQEKLTQWATAAGFKVQNWPLLWLKPAGEAKNDASYRNFTKACEYVMVLHKGETTLRKPHAVNWWIASVKGERNQQLNPFLKPFSISKELIESSIVPGMKMLDCFAGGGSLVRAAVNLGIEAYGIEKDKEQFPSLYESIKSTYVDITGGNVEFT
jgi:ParB-like chromosome segregation protein Spo0J/DNA modification methylase